MNEIFQAWIPKKRISTTLGPEPQAIATQSLGDKDGDGSIRRFLILLFVKDGSPARGKSHHGLVQQASVFELDKTFYERVFPYGMSGTRSLPCLHGLAIGPATT